ncbi:MAG: GAF domain-containing protein [Anaerolineae bacterium]|nr:GAF domain-containing protein [Anaerolineae bacterium]
MTASDQTVSKRRISRSTRTQESGYEERLNTIFEVAHILAVTSDLGKMLPQLLDSLINKWEAADAGILTLYNADDNVLVPAAAHGFRFDRLKDVRLAPGEAMGGTALVSERAELYATPEDVVKARANLTSANRELFHQARAGMPDARSAVCIPLTAGTKKIGTFLLENQRQDSWFVAEDLPFLKAVSDLIALAIENARLRTEVDMARSLEEANRLKAEVISTLAHEMRTPLTSIKGYSTALLMEEGLFSPQAQREFLQIIDEECTVLQSLISDLLESSIIEAGFLKLELQPLNLPRLAQQVTVDYMRASPKHRFLVDFPPHFPIVDGDPDRIGQVLRNLLDNAVKYSPDGGLVVVRGDAGAEEVTISVADQGVGIAPEHLNRLFEKYFRIEQGLGRHVVGSGLGLPICHAIVETHGGRIWAESELGQGTTLYFTLPLNREELGE